MKGGAKKIGAMLLALCLVAAPAMADAASRKDRAMEKRLRDHIEMLASDEFMGREPGTEGEALTLRYLGRTWFDIGLISGTNDPGNEWFAPVTLVAREPDASTARFTRRGRAIAVPESEYLMLTSGKRALVRDAPLLFVGHGDNIDDIARSDLAGRIAVMLDGGEDAGERQDALLAAGALAVLTVLDGERTLAQVAARRQRSGYALADDSLGGDLEGFITRAGMEVLLRPTRYRMDRLIEWAERERFVPQLLGARASLEATTQETTIRTFNMIGKLPGKDPESGAVLFVAHWDHFGVCGEASAEDTICNGAVDNASGVAALTEIARALAKSSKLDRDVYFLASTAEELGLLGAHAFAENPPVPVQRFVAAFNIDSPALAPGGTPLAIVGAGMSGLDEEIAKVAAREDRKLVASEEAEEFTRRQDGWALLQHDIPAVMVTSAYSNPRRLHRYLDEDYHRPSDDPTREIELGGAVEDINFHIALAKWFGNRDSFPGKPERIPGKEE